MKNKKMIKIKFNKLGKKCLFTTIKKLKKDLRNTKHLLKEKFMIFLLLLLVQC
jgi:hypothetical protein